MDNPIEEKTECRVCQSAELIDFLDLGEIPPANGFIDDLDEVEKTFPLVVSVCDNCHHVQLKNTVSRELLFSNYHYFSSSSSPIVEHFDKYARSIKHKYLEGGDFVVEIGSNDGVLLQNFEEYERLGIEPAENIANEAEKKGVPTRVDFFQENVATDVRKNNGQAKVIMANNVVGHIDDLQSLMRGVSELLTPDGTFVVEVPYFVDLYNGNKFDTIYHEHISYFTIQSFTKLANRHDMVVADVRRVPVHGGSIRVHLQNSEYSKERGPLVDDLLTLERAMILDDPQTYHDFAERIETYKERIRTLLDDLVANGATVAGYGAPAKGNILLNYCEIDSEIVDFVIDTTPAKQGTYTPGSSIPVYPPEKLHQESPDYALLLAWNYRDAILEKEETFREESRFIIPIPYLDIV